jgi:signal transduction histidine kinase
MKCLVTSVCLCCIISLGHAQNKTFTTFHDYLVRSANLDSLRKAVRSTPPKPQSTQYLQLLILTDLATQNQGFPLDVNKTAQTLRLATKQKAQIGIAMTNFLMGRYYAQDRDDSLAYDYQIKAERIFTKNKDTTGMLYCYHQLWYSVADGSPALAKRYFKKIITLSTTSSNPSDMLLYYRLFLSADPNFEKRPTEAQLQAAFTKGNALIDRYPYLEHTRRYLYRSIQQGYANLNRYEKVLEVGLQMIQDSKIGANDVDYQNLGRTYIRLKKYNEAIAPLERANKEIKVNDPGDLRRQRNINKLLKEAYYNVGNLKASIQADQEYDRLNEIIFRNDRSLAMMSLKEKYSFTEKETELQRLALEKQVIESKNKLLDAENRSAVLRNIALENQATQSKAKLLKTQMEVIKKESAIQRAEAQTKLLLGGLIMTLLLIGVVLIFSIRLRQTNKKLIELQAARDKFYTIIAHDLRTPLNSLHNLGLLIRNLLQQDRKEDIETIVKHIEQMDQHSHLIVNNLLEWGKVQSFNKEAAATPQKTDIALLLQEVCQSYIPIAEAKGISLLVKTLPSFVLQTNAKSLTIALRNLIDNAIKHTPKGGEIMVSSALMSLTK